MKKYCQICNIELTSENRRKSHILTKATFFDKQSLNPGEHAMLVVGNEQPKIVDAGHQAWEHILCSSCEQKFAIWEQEREKFLSSAPRPTKPPTEERSIEVKGFNQTYIVLACLADLFRGSVAQKEAYSKINLGPKHEAKIKYILQSGTITDFSEYPIVFSRFMKDSNEIDEAIKYPQRVKLPYLGRRYNVYETIAPGGWTWIVKVDSQRFELMNYCALDGSTTIHILNQGDFLTDTQNARHRKAFIKTVHLIDSLQAVTPPQPIESCFISTNPSVKITT